ncbi:MAG: M6 family metalloprotease domain-containing protein [Muribaculaceae bacterium]|nr:M6 family metalloprotease domain-containing protein [Muribaculaceae bacterium]
MNKKIIAAALAALICAASADAKPAKRGVFNYTQPDGTQLSVRLVGDERSHIYMTEDGMPLMHDAQGRLCYALVGTDGKVTPSAMMATDASKRSVTATSLLSSQNPEKAFNALNREILSNSPIALSENTFPAWKKDRLNSTTGELKSDTKVPQSGVGLCPSSFPPTGPSKALVILVQYSDISFTLPDPHQYFNDLLNKEGFSQYGATGSVSEYFHEASMGQFQPQFDLYGPVTLPNTRAYYGGNDYWGNDQNPHMMAVHACQALDATVDFSQYDNDKDGYIDNVFIFYAGTGEASGGPAASVWPHSWDVSNGTSTVYRFDGVRLDHYACSNEWESGRPDGIGTFVHEFSHVLGLPDLYTTDYGSAASVTPGSYEVLDYGPYNNDGCTPPTYSAYARNAMGWLDVEVLDGEPASVQLSHIMTSNKACLIPHPTSNTEFFLLENRQTVGSDAYIPYHGMLVWHIDYVPSVWNQNSVNNTKGHQYVDIVEAGGQANNYNTTIMKEYPFPGTKKVTELSAKTSPALRTWNGADVNCPISNITETNGIITFDVAGGLFDLATPTGVKADNITPIGATLSWTAVDRALGYEVNVYTKNASGAAVAVEGWEDTYIPSGTSVTISTLEPETEYFFTVAARASRILSEPSAEQSFTTTEMTFGYTTPVIKDATEVDENGFVANWEEHPEAYHYLLTVTGYVDGDPVAETATMGSQNSTKVELPEGWITNAASAYTSASMAGNAVPSLKMDESGTYLQTRVFEKDIVGLSFTVKGAGAASTNSLDIAAAGVDGAFTVFHTIKPISASRQTMDLSDKLPEGSRAIKFIYNKIGSGNVALDDVSIEIPAITEKVLDGYDHKDVGNVTSHRVANNIGASRFLYSVQAVHQDGTVTNESARAEVKVDTSAIRDITVDAADADAPVEYFNLQGIRVNNPSNGVYIRRQGNSVTKITVK